MYEDWHVYSRGPMPLYRLDFFEAMRRGALEHNKKTFCKILYTCEKDVSYWAWSRDGISEWSEILLDKIANPEMLEKHYGEYGSFCRRSNEASEKIRNEKLEGKSDQELEALYEFLEAETESASGLLNIDLDVFDIDFDAFLGNKMKENLKSNNIAISEKEFAEMFRELSAPIYTTFVAQEEKAIAEVAIKNEIHEEEIEKLSDSFWWVSLGWENIIPRNSGYYEMKVKELIEQKNAEEIIAEIEKRPKENRQKRKEILQKYDLGGEIKRLLEVFDKFAYFHDLRKEIQMRAMFAFNLLLSEVARRFKLKDDEKELYTRKEILNMLKGEKVDAEEIKRRKRAVFLVVERDGVRMLSGDEAITAREAELKQETKRVDQFRGIVAMKGKVTARVKVCNGVNDAIEKLKSGEILAVGMTTPDYAPVMRIAGAIITNEGGITCHAAIVSRELGIPCIVGTKIATQVLKDGDLVEVDADNGVVRIIEKS